MTPSISRIDTEHAPKALGPYSQGIVIENFTKLIFVSGQLPIDLESGRLVEGDVRLKTRTVIDHIEAVLKSAGSSLQHVVRVEVFLTHLTRDFPAMNLEYLVRFNHMPAPARQTIGVTELPMGSPLEMSCIAVIPN